MREIKFRGWHSKMERMFSCDEMVNDQMTLLPDGRFINVNGNSTQLSVIYPSDKFIPLQYTGLKDKNGKESCGHDIVRVTFAEFYSSSQFCSEEGESVVGVIKEIDYAWAVELPDKSYIYFSEIVNDDMEFEIIGNVHENPELVK